MKNKIGQSMERGIAKALLVGIAVVGLAMGFESDAQAQERFRFDWFTNSTFITPYTQIVASTNGLGQLTYTNAFYPGVVTQTNNSPGYYPATASVVDVTKWQNVPVTFFLDGAITNSAAGSSNIVAFISLSQDQVYWTSNSASVTLTSVGNGNNLVAVTVPLVNGTNAFTGWEWARWDGLTTSGTNCVVNKFGAGVYR